MQPWVKRRNLAKRLDEAISEIKSLRAKNAILTKKLYSDGLTGIANRLMFDEKLPELIKLAQNEDEPLGLLIADVNGLKRTNDTLGHPAGDELLKKVAVALKHASRATDLPGRLGGDEFYIILPGFRPMDGQTETELLNEVTDRYQASADSSLTELKIPLDLAVKLSFGIAILGEGETAKDLFNRADQLCQVNKQKFYAKLRSSGVVFKDDRL